MDNTPTGGGSGGSNQDNGGGDDNTDDGGEDQILYPTGDPYDDSLYDDGGTTIVISPAPHAANFGGSLHVKLPDNPVIGDSGVATVDVFNTGGRATGTFDLALGVSADGSAGSATRVAYETVPVRLGHDRVAVYKLPFTLPATLSPGTYRFLALIDAGNAFAESDESDNVAVGPSFTVAAAITDVGVTSATTRATVRPGQPAALAVHVKSMGTVAESGTTSVTVTATPVDGSSAPLQLMTVDRKVQLRRGQAATLKLKVPLPTLAAGQYQLTVTITPVSASDGNAADKSAVTNVMTVK